MEFVFHRTFKPRVEYNNADWAKDLQTQKSVFGFLFKIGSRAINWSSKQQTTLLSSICNAEYIA